MSIYQCDECGCAENTALGWYHCRTMKGMVGDKYYGKKLCSACGPTHFSDGTKIDKMGGWHGRFERVFYPIGTMTTDKNGNLAKKEDVPDEDRRE